MDDMSGKANLCMFVDIRFVSLLFLCFLFQVSKFLDISKLDYRRYADVLFDVLFAGGQLGMSKCIHIRSFG